MPKILRIHNRLIIGGPTLNALYLTKYLAPEFETLLVVGEKDHHEKDAGFLAKEMGISTVIVPEMGRDINLMNDYKAYRAIKKIIGDFKPDIVHTHAAKPGAVGRMAAFSSRVPVVIHTYHGHVFHSYFGKLKTNFIINTERYLAKKTDAIIAISEQQKKELVNDFKIAEEEKFRIVPLGFELQKFQEQYEEKRKKFRNEFALQDDEIAIGIIGRLVPVKNHQLFLEGIHHVLQNCSKKIKAFVVGDGETRPAMEATANNLGIQFSKGNGTYDHDATLIFTSWRSDVDTINAGLDIVALTSLNEGTPVSLIEAQAANKPVISTKVGGIQDIVSEGKTALLSNIDDPLGFKENLLKIVTDEYLRNRLGKNGADLVFKKYSVNRLAADMRKLYLELLNKESAK